MDPGVTDEKYLYPVLSTFLSQMYSLGITCRHRKLVDLEDVWMCVVAICLRTSIDVEKD